MLKNEASNVGLYYGKRRENNAVISKSVILKYFNIIDSDSPTR